MRLGVRGAGDAKTGTIVIAGENQLSSNGGIRIFRIRRRLPSGAVFVRRLVGRGRLSFGLGEVAPALMDTGVGVVAVRAT